MLVLAWLATVNKVVIVLNKELTAGFDTNDYWCGVESNQISHRLNLFVRIRINEKAVSIVELHPYSITL